MRKIIIPIIMVILILVLIILMALSKTENKDDYYEYNYELLDYEEYEPYMINEPKEGIVPVEYYEKDTDEWYVKLENDLIVNFDNTTKEVLQIALSERGGIDVLQYSPTGIKILTEEIESIKFPSDYYTRLVIILFPTDEHDEIIFKGRIDGSCVFPDSYTIEEDPEVCQEYLDYTVEQAGYGSIEEMLEEEFGEMIRKVE